MLTRQESVSIDIDCCCVNKGHTLGIAELLQKLHTILTPASMKNLLKIYLLLFISVNMISCVSPQGRMVRGGHPTAPAYLAGGSGGGGYSSSNPLHPSGSDLALMSAKLNTLLHVDHQDRPSGWSELHIADGHEEIITLPNGRKIRRVFHHVNCDHGCDRYRRSDSSVTPRPRE